MSQVGPVQILFLIFSALMLASSLGVIFSRNQVNAAMSLVATFFFLAADYALLAAHTLAVLQVLVYAGAIVVLFLFVIMLLSLRDPPAVPNDFSPRTIFTVLAGLGVAVAVLMAVQGGSGMNTVISDARDDGNGQLTLKFESTPFVAAPYATAAIGEGRNESSSFEVLSVAANGEHVVRVLGSNKPEKGQKVALSWRANTVQKSYGTMAEIGKLMFVRYLFPFEVTSLLLLVSIVGAVVVSKGKI